jgi:hypothetical protein
MKAVKSFIENEDDGKINWSPNGAAMYAVVNKDKKNPHGEYPGYRITPGQYPMRTLNDAPSRLTDICSNWRCISDGSGFQQYTERSTPHDASSLRHSAEGQ